MAFPVMLLLGFLLHPNLLSFELVTDAAAWPKSSVATRRSTWDT